MSLKEKWNVEIMKKVKKWEFRVFGGWKWVLFLLFIDRINFSKGEIVNYKRIENNSVI